MPLATGGGRGGRAMLEACGALLVSESKQWGGGGEVSPERRRGEGAKAGWTEQRGGIVGEREDGSRRRSDGARDNATSGREGIELY